jgi:hypothetical protein
MHQWASQSSVWQVWRGKFTFHVSWPWCIFAPLLPYESELAQTVQCLTMDWTTGIQFPKEAENFSSSLCIQTDSGAHPAFCMMGMRGPFLRDKVQLGCDFDHPPPSNAKVNTSSPPQVPAWCSGTTLPFTPMLDLSKIEHIWWKVWMQKGSCRRFLLFSTFFLSKNSV